jgi:hypothetical protein
MATRPRRARTFAVLLATGVMTLLSGATTASAGGSAIGTTTDGSKIWVTVTTSTSMPGSPGGGGVTTQSIPVPPPCWFSVEKTGKEYFDYMKTNGSLDAQRENWLKYQKDDKGHWYTGQCASANWPNQQDLSGWFTYVDQFDLTPQYVPFTQQEPQSPVTPELLRDVAINNLTPPPPHLDWNPKLAANQATLVNLETWFWLDKSPTSLQVSAASGGLTATVTATFAGMDISAPFEQTAPCPGPGTAYAPGAKPTCYLAFSRASSYLGLPATPVTVATTWLATWADSVGGDHGLIAAQPSPVTAPATNIQVDEVQTLVTGTS